MCTSDLQVDLVGSEKLNNSMGFSMFFVGLGCLTGPPLAGEWITSWRTFRWLARADPTFPNVHKCTAYALHIYWMTAMTLLFESDLLHRGQGELCTRFCVGSECGRWLTDLLMNIYFLSCVAAHIFTAF